MEIFNRKSIQEFFDIKCCYLEVRDHEKHYQRMSQRYNLFIGFNYPILKTAYISSLPQEILMAKTQKGIKIMSLGDMCIFETMVVKFIERIIPLGYSLIMFFEVSCFQRKNISSQRILVCFFYQVCPYH
jgi:hypothetical protein